MPVARTAVVADPAPAVCGREAEPTQAQTPGRCRNFEAAVAKASLMHPRLAPERWLHDRPGATLG